MKITYVRFANSTRQHTLKGDRRTFCEDRVLTPHVDWSRAQMSEEPFDLPLCYYCERLGPVSEAHTSRYWQFSETEAGHPPLAAVDETGSAYTED